MLRQNLGRATRFLRRGRSWRQRDLATRSGVSRETISRLERGEIGGMTIRFMDRIAAALGATLVVELRWHGEQLDRLMDRGHAALEETVVRDLRSASWTTEVEVSFNWYGDRGRCDAVAMHPSKRILLIVEAKTSLGDVQDLLGRLDVKVRMGAQIAKQIGGPSLRALSRACSWPMDGQHAEWWPRIPNCSRASRIVAGPRIAGSPRQPRTKASVGC